MSGQRTPIEPSDIRKGDLIRKEYSTPHARCDADCVATEYRATSDAHGMGGAGQHYLLERLEPAVQLPTEATLGWIDSRHVGHAVQEKRALGFFAQGENDREFEQPAADEFGASGRKINQHYRVTAFTPAVAVPADALDELRATCTRDCEALGCGCASAAHVFLAAVTKAGEQS